MIAAFYLEIAVLVLGLVILLVDAFAEHIDKRSIAVAAMIGLGAVLLASFFLSPAPVVSPGATGFWSFYTADTLAIFFKRFALVTTIFVLIMMIDYAPIVRSTIHGVTAQAGLGEFFALPVFTCAGLMWMASAVDFVMIFVSLELVTVSFYVLVSFTRRNPLALEAGVKYLILSAVSTGFLVYGITWIFGVTGETNLDRVTAALARPEIEHAPALFGMVLVLVALGFKIAAVPFQIWVPDVYQGAPTPVTAFLSVGSKAAGFVVLLRVLRPFFMLPQMERRPGGGRDPDADLRKSGGASAGESQATARLLEHRARRLFADRCGLVIRTGSRVLPGRLPAHDPSGLCCFGRGGATHW